MYNFVEKKIIIKIKEVIFKYCSDNIHKFFLYWSRVRWDIRDKSDYDIWVIWDEPLNIVTFYDIKEEFENIPALIDFTDFSKVSEKFKNEAMKDIIWLN